jgi:hypothetical protein
MCLCTRCSFFFYLGNPECVCAHVVLFFLFGQSWMCLCARCSFFLFQKKKTYTKTHSGLTNKKKRTTCAQTHSGLPK